MRYPHLLRVTRPGAFPSQMLALCAEYAWVETDEQPPTREAVISGWAGLGARGKCGVYGSNVAREGTDVAALWAEIDRCLKRGGVTWCFAPEAPRLWAAVGLWGMIERGEATITGKDTRAASGDGEPNRPERMGYLVLDGAVFVADIRRPGLSGTLRIIDLANYGAAINPAPKTGAQGAAATMAFVRGMIAALLSRRMGGLKATVGSQAMTAFTTAYLTEPMEVHCNERALQLERRGYYGGRCEAFTLGTAPGRAWHLDVSAMYASLCRSISVPVSLSFVRHDLAQGELRGVGAEEGMVADVTLTVDEPAFPFRCERRKLTIWPVGTFATTLAGAELVEALRMGAVQHIHACSYYLCKPALKAYAEMALALRTEHAADPLLSCWAKSMGNALVGKLGQQDRRWVDDTSGGVRDAWDFWSERDKNGQWERWRSVAWRVQREECGGWGAEAVPAAAAFITAAARMKLLELIRCAGWMNVHYVDTDSLMVTDRGLERLEEAGWLRPGEPGYLRVKRESGVLWVGGLKDYDEDGARTKAGAPSGTLSGGRQSGTAWLSVSVGDHCRAGRAPRAVQHQIGYLAGGIYRHGTRLANGRVLPIRIGGSGE